MISPATRGQGRLLANPWPESGPASDGTDRMVVARAFSAAEKNCAGLKWTQYDMQYTIYNIRNTKIEPSLLRRSASQRRARLRRMNRLHSEAAERDTAETQN